MSSMAKRTGSVMKKAVPAKPKRAESPKKQPAKRDSANSNSTVDLANDTKFWDVIAPDYDAEILSTIDENTCPSIMKVLNKYAATHGATVQSNRRGVVADFGCGVGKYLPTLSKRYKTVVGMDFSKGLLDVAKKKIAGDKNCSLLPALSLTNSKQVKSLLSSQIKKAEGSSHTGLVDFGVCTNVLLSPDVAIQQAILRTLSMCIRPKGHLLLLVPSAESHLWTVWSALKGPGSSEPDIFMEFYSSYFNEDEPGFSSPGSSPKRSKKAAEKEFNDQKDKYFSEYGGAYGTVSKLDTVLNIVPRGDEGVRTQHFLKEQIIEMCKTVGFKTLNVEKSEYKWETEIDFESLDENAGEINRMMGLKGKQEPRGKRIENKFQALNSGPWDWVLTLQKE